jgi:hypothetical protein
VAERDARGNPLFDVERGINPLMRRKGGAVQGTMSAPELEDDDLQPERHSLGLRAPNAGTGGSGLQQQFVMERCLRNWIAYATHNVGTKRNPAQLLACGVFEPRCRSFRPIDQSGSTLCAARSSSLTLGRRISCAGPARAFEPPGRPFFRPKAERRGPAFRSRPSGRAWAGLLTYPFARRPQTSAVHRLAASLTERAVLSKSVRKTRAGSTMRHSPLALVAALMLAVLISIASARNAKLAPAELDRFERVVAMAYAEWLTDDNPLRRLSAIEKRGLALLKVIGQNANFTDWHLEVVLVGTDIDGAAWVALTVPKDRRDPIYHFFLINLPSGTEDVERQRFEPGSLLHGIAKELNKGDLVAASGSFLKDPASGIVDGGAGAHHSVEQRLREPWFLVKYTSMMKL